MLTPRLVNKGKGGTTMGFKQISLNTLDSLLRRPWCARVVCSTCKGSLSKFPVDSPHKDKTPVRESGKQRDGQSGGGQSGGGLSGVG